MNVVQSNMYSAVNDLAFSQDFSKSLAIWNDIFVQIVTHNILNNFIFSVTERLKKKCVTVMQLIEMKEEIERISSSLGTLEEEDESSKLTEEEKKGRKEDDKE